MNNAMKNKVIINRMKNKQDNYNIKQHEELSQKSIFNHPSYFVNDYNKTNNYGSVLLDNTSMPGSNVSTTYNKATPSHSNYPVSNR